MRNVLGAFPPQPPQVRWPQFIHVKLFAAWVVLLLALMALILVGSDETALAAPHRAGDGGDGGALFAIQPTLYDPTQPLTQSYFIFDTRPGAVLHSQARITNSGSAVGTALLYAVDATTGANSGVVYLGRQQPRRDVGSWLSLDTTSVTLAPGQSAVVGFMVTVPASVRSGQHVGGLVAESAPIAAGDAQPSAINVQIQNLAIAAVQVNLPGAPVEQMIASGVQATVVNGRLALTLALQNTGTMMLKPTGALTVYDSQKRLVESCDLKLNTFLPQTSIAYPVYGAAQSLLGAGVYKAALTLSYGQSENLRYSASFTLSSGQAAQIRTTHTGATAPDTQATLFGVHLVWDSATIWASLFFLLVALILLRGVLQWRRRQRTRRRIPRRRARASAHG